MLSLILLAMLPWAIGYGIYELVTDEDDGESGPDRAQNGSMNEGESFDALAPSTDSNANGSDENLVAVPTSEEPGANPMMEEPPIAEDTYVISEIPQSDEDDVITIDDTERGYSGDISTGAGDDTVSARILEESVVDLGTGNDSFVGIGYFVTVQGGEGDDVIDFTDGRLTTEVRYVGDDPDFDFDAETDFETNPNLSSAYYDDENGTFSKTTGDGGQYSGYGDLRGGAGNDTITASMGFGDAPRSIDGGPGDDDISFASNVGSGVSVAGGEGADVFSYFNLTDLIVDHPDPSVTDELFSGTIADITDFEPGVDTMEIALSPRENEHYSGHVFTDDGNGRTVLTIGYEGNPSSEEPSDRYEYSYAITFTDGAPLESDLVFR